jgi:hypothetical protein
MGFSTLTGIYGFESLGCFVAQRDRLRQVLGRHTDRLKTLLKVGKALALDEP